jgi:hypothetical protein
MPVSISGTNGVTFPDSSLQAAAASPYTLKNKIINGDMKIDQRNAGASVTPTTAATGYPVDRFGGDCSVNSKYTLQQSTTAPTGFNYSLKVTSSSAYSVGAGDYFYISQVIEGYNVADLGFGTANAKTFTLSFWVQSSLTGTFGGSFRNGAGNRSYPFTYTISAANTWEQKSVTVAGDTSGTWLTTNGAGLRVEFGLGVGTTYSGTAGSWAGATYLSATGATSVVGTSGATFYITGVQLEQNTSATPFERRLYGQELANCQRYYYKAAQGVASVGVPVAAGYYVSSSVMNSVISLPVTMRTSPVLSAATGTDYYSFYRNGASDTFNSLTLDIASPNYVAVYNSSEISGTAGQAGLFFITNNTPAAFIAFSAEL